MTTPKQAAFAASLDTEAKFFAAVARTCDAIGEPELSAAAQAHAEALQRRHALALLEPEPKATKPKARPTRRGR